MYKGNQLITAAPIIGHRKLCASYNPSLSIIGTIFMDKDDYFDPDSQPAEGERPPLSLRQIEVFRTIMMAGSISGAGRILHVSQPAISRVLALTESRLGYQLFERLRSRLSPTPEARRLYAEVEEVYNGIQRVNELASNLGQTGSGTLKILSSPSFGQRLIPSALSQFRTRNRNARVDYRTVTFDEQVSYFLSGQADIGVSMCAPNHPHLVSVKVAEVPVSCVVPATHSLARLPVISASDMAQAAWIGYPSGTPLDQALTPFFAQANVVAAPVLDVHSPVTAWSFVQQGLGLAFVDEWCLPEVPSDHVLVKPIYPEVSVEIWATRSDLQPLPLLGKRFLAALKTTLASKTPSYFVHKP
jgi:DNA-binding transcriptional LysR family regulator